MKKLMDIYYKIWVDCMVRIRSQEKNKHNWQEKSIIVMTIAMTFNFILFMTILERNILGCSFYEINLSSLSDSYNNILTILILFVLPCVIINGLLIFRKSRYKMLIKKYPYHNGKLITAYWLISLFLPVVLLFVGIIIYQDVTFWSFLGK